MKPEQIRNIAVVGHGSAGKTMLTEALLFATGSTTRLGRIEDGTATTDFEPEENERQISVSLAMAPVTWEGTRLNLIDCPGYADFNGDVVSALRVADACLFVVSAVDGVQVQTELIWDAAQDLGLPCLIVVNKLDRERASFSRTLDELRDAFGTKPFPLHVPIGEEHDFAGAVDLLQMKAFTYDQQTPKGSAGDIPAALAGQVDEYRTRLVEAAAEGDDELLEKYLEAGELDEKEVSTGLSKSVAGGSTAPVLVSSATHLVGIDLLARALTSLAPPPSERAPVKGTSTPDASDEVVRQPSGDEPLCAFVFKTISDPYVGKISVFRVFSGHLRPDHHVFNANRGIEERVGQAFHMRGKHHDNAAEIGPGDIGAVAKLAHTETGDTLCDKAAPIVLPAIEFPEPVLSVAVEPHSRGDEEKLSSSLARLVEEDPVLRVERNAETHQTIVSGLGETHLDVVMTRMKRKFGVEVQQVPLRIAYRETVKGRGDYLSRHVKQSGGRGQYAVCHLIVEPVPSGSGYSFVNKIVGGAIPGNYIPSVDKGVQGALKEGALAGYPVVDVQVTLDDGKFHTVDSSDMAFQIAGSMGFKEAARLGGLTLLEPLMDVKVRVPSAMLGDIMGDINSKRGKVMGTEPDARGYQMVHASVPMAEMLRYAIDLRSMTGGRGTFTMSFSHYEEVPQHLQAKIVEQSKTEVHEAGKH